MREKSMGKCNLQCPFPTVTPKTIRNILFCCGLCNKSRKTYLNEHPKLKKYWSDEDGFASKDGCRLTRDSMPKTCKNYDCHEYEFQFRLTWDGNTWNVEGQSKKVR